MRVKGRPSRRMVAGALFLVLLLVGLLLPSSYIVQSPGPVLDVTGEANGHDIVEIAGVQTYDSDTEFLMTTVTARGNADAGVPGIVVAGALLTKSQEVLPVRSLYPAQVSSEQISDRNLALMDYSQDAAAAVALERAGMDVGMTLRVSGVPEDSPSYGNIMEGDVIDAISVPSLNLPDADEDGFCVIHTFFDLSTILDQTPAGTAVILRVRNDGQEREVTTTTRAPEPDTTGWTAPGSKLGVYVEVRDVELPADVTYAIDGIGGPSAGTMFTLAIYDAVTEGSLGGDAVIAGTGSIAWDGDIEAIGGIRHKINGARAAGATDFLAPAVNCPETAGYEPDGLNLWAVRNIDEAIEAVEAIGSGDTSTLTPCSAVPSGEE